MSWQHFDPDEYETVVESRPCSCVGTTRGCDGRCNGSFSMGMRRRAPEEVARVRAERIQREEDEILRQADEIRARRQA